MSNMSDLAIQLFFIMASLFSLHETMLTDPNYVGWLRNLQIRFVSEKNLDVLDIPDPGLVSNNKMAKDVYRYYLFIL